MSLLSIKASSGLGTAQPKNHKKIPPPASNLKVLGHHSTPQQSACFGSKVIFAVAPGIVQLDIEADVKQPGGY